MLDAIQEWIDRIRAIDTPFGGVTVAAPRKVGSRDEAIRYFVEAGLELRQSAITGSGELAKKIIAMRNFLQLHHALMPDGAWKDEIEAAIARIVATRDKHTSAGTEKDGLVELKRDIEHLLDAIDLAFQELSA